MAHSFKFKMAATLKDLCFMVILTSNVLLTVHGLPPLYQYNATNRILPSDHEKVHINISSTPLVYMGRAYNDLWISQDGFIGFYADETFKNQIWSGNQVSPFIDKAFIGPYYYSAYDLDLDPQYTGRVYYTMRTPSDPYFPTLTQFGQYIQSQAVGSKNFNPKWGLMVTWANVTDNTQNRCGASCPANNFQAVLLADSTDSYVILNYGTMNAPTTQFTQAGFNGGNGTGWFPVSFNGGVSSLSMGQGSDTKGRYVFKISSENILRAGCSNDPSYKTLSIYPTYGGMLGGKMIDISGPCLQQNQQIKCKFGSVETMASYVSQTRARCVVPRLMQRGAIQLSLSVNNGMSYPYSTTFFSVFPGRLPKNENLDPVVTLSNPMWYGLTPPRLQVKWDSTILSNTSSAYVDINLYGYKEAGSKGNFTKLATLGTARASDGQYDFDTSQYTCNGQACFDFEIGILEVRLQSQFYPIKYRYLSSKTLPLGWYVNQAMTNSYGSNWMQKKCVDWYNSDRQNMAWLQQQPSCPCTLEQAIADFGRWQADVSCNINIDNSNINNCYYHSGAVHCVRSVFPSQGGGNQCCYDGSHQLMYSADSNFGSTPDKYHDWGSSPYQLPGTVPLLSHWIVDVVPFYYCCIWTQYQSCGYYMAQRPTRDCVNYMPPVVASVYGQGHVTTFGGTTYRMFGPGDYNLLTADMAMIQGRFQKNLFPTRFGRVTTTFSLGSVAVQDKSVQNSDVVEIRLTGPNYSNRNRKLEVRVNRKYVRFDKMELYWQDFTGVSVLNSDTNMPNTQSNFTIMLRNGIGLQVANKNNIMELDLTVPQNFSGNVSGLFGDLSGNLQTPNGTNFTTQMMTTPSYVYNNFQLAWATNDSNRLFRDSLPANHSIHGKLDLQPTPIPGVPRSQFCGNDQICNFDYMHTGSDLLAQATNAGRNRNLYLSSSAQPVRTCGLLNVPNAKKDNTNYTLNSTVYLTSCSSGSLSGPNQYVCTAGVNGTQNWYPSVTSTCAVQTASADVGLIVGVIIAVIFVIAIVIIIIVLMLRRRRSTTRTSERRERRARYDPDEERVKTDRERPESGNKGNEYSV